MPEGRMLKKAITTSMKLAELKTDTARLLYTWLIPFLDIEGRYFSDPHVIKGSIFPRITSITPEIITECLTDMQNCGLIIVYGWNGDTYLQYVKFKDHQSLRADKERPSHIPAPGTKDTSPVLLPDYSRSTPAEDKIREDKIREEIHMRKKAPQPEAAECEKCFFEFWNAYEKKIDKQKCKQWYAKHASNGTHAAIMKGIEKWKSSGQWDDPQYQPYPYTFLFNRRWEDEPPLRLTNDQRKQKELEDRFIREGKI